MAYPSHDRRRDDTPHSTLNPASALIPLLDGKTTVAAVEATLFEGPPAPPFARAEAAKAQILAVLDTVERDVGDLRSVPIADFEATMLRSGLVDDEAIARLRGVIAAYSKPSTRRHVDIGVHVREMLTE